MDFPFLLKLWVHVWGGPKQLYVIVILPPLISYVPEALIPKADIVILSPEKVKV